MLEPGGVIGTVTWGADQEMPRADIWDAELDAHGAKPEAMPDIVRQHTLMDTPAKVRGLLEAAGLAPLRLWSERFERHWTWQDLYTVRTGFGLYRRRLATLPEDRRRQCLARLRDRMAALAPHELVYRPEIIFALARR